MIRLISLELVFIPAFIHFNCLRVVCILALYLYTFYDLFVRRTDAGAVAVAVAVVTGIWVLFVVKVAISAIGPAGAALGCSADRCNCLVVFTLISK